METVVLRSFDNYFSANIILTRLQYLGISCYLKDEYTVTIDPILSNAIGGIKLAVHSRDASKAAALLKAFDDEFMKAAVCPRCNRCEIISVVKPGPINLLTVIITWFFSSYAVAAETVYQCQHCLYQSATLPVNTAEYN